MNYRVILFYKYIYIDNTELLREDIFSFCQQNNIKGRIFIAGEGINGTASGLVDDIESFKHFIVSKYEFSDIVFKEDAAEEHAFRKLHVRIKNEIVTSGLNVTPGMGSKRLPPEKLKEFYDSGKEFVIIDARNNYETNIGKFKNAIIPPIENFREWSITSELYSEYKDKTVVTYCTGGIRCEKASAYLVQQGFKDVYQLDGGIINYVKQFPDTYWEGSVFIFDERRLVEVNQSPELKHIAKCYYCGTAASYYINCHNQDCDKIIISCHDCKAENGYCCSDECRRSENKRKRVHG